MIIIILLIIIFVSLVFNLSQAKKFKETFGAYKSIGEILEQDMKTLNEQVESRRKEMYNIIENERVNLREEMHKKREVLELELEKEREAAQTEYLDLKEKFRKKQECLEEEYKQKFELIEEDKDTIQKALDEMKTRQEKTIDMMKEQEKDKNEIDFHRIVFSTQEHSDIKLLLEVEKKLYNKDVLRKLIYKTYVENLMNEMFSRIGINNNPGVYKIENIKNKKVYIGQSTNVRNRLREHIKSSLGISTIANQAVHEAMAEQGLENFTFYLIDDCGRDVLNQREKYWIDFYRSNEWGYNRTRGGS